MKALVVKSTGGIYRLRLENGEYVSAQARGVFRLNDSKATNPITVGDFVEVECTGEGQWVITSLEERKNFIARRSPNLSKQVQVLATNLDCVLLLATLKKPVTYPEFIDRLLVSAEAFRVSPIVVFNKIDLIDTTEEKQSLEELIGLYRSIGYPCLSISVEKNEGIEELAQLLKGKTTLISGNSGVGKTSLINLLIPSLRLKVGDLSSAHQKGMHTTTFSELFPLPFGGNIIDTPGVKGFGVIEIEAEELSHYFPEMFRLSSQCKYYNCTHTHEPDCAVLNALEREDGISSSRYRSYLKMLEDYSDKEKYRRNP